MGTGVERRRRRSGMRRMNCEFLSCKVRLKAVSTFAKRSR